MNHQGNKSTLSLIHLDDDPFELERVKVALEDNNLGAKFKVTSSEDPENFAKLVKQQKPEIVLLDIHLEAHSIDGIEMLQKVKSNSPKTIVLMFSTADDAGTIGKCLSTGADDFISKQSDKGELSLRIANSYRLAILKSGHHADQKSQPKPTKFAGETIRLIAKRIPLIIDSAISAVHVVGESGTGKEVVADLFSTTLGPSIPFIKVNCGAIAPSLLESELFGHIKGAFTGAAADKKGYFESASGGWIFLDELATLPQNAQVALLRVLDSQELVKVGSSRPISVNVRVLSATNENIGDMVAQGKFRKDLWQRLRETEVLLPPLRDRSHEIGDLVDAFCKNMPGGPYQISGPAMEVLKSASWQEGNIRELRNCLRAMTEMHVNKLLIPLSIPSRIWEELGENPEKIEEQDCPPVVAGSNLTLNLDAGVSFDRLQEQLLMALVRHLASKNGKMSLRALSAAIGVSRSTLSGRLKNLTQKGVIKIEDLSKLVGISDK